MQQGIDESVSKVVSFFSNNFNSYETVTQRLPYNHMGATITDAILQAGMNYKNVVYPRILNILTKYPCYTTTCDFIILFQTIPIEEITNWRNKKKLQLICDLSWNFFDKGVNNERQLSEWLNYSDNTDELLKITGIGYKTIDYLKLLSGCQVIPIDRHMFQFLKIAGVCVKTYKEASEILKRVANILDIKESIVDFQIWSYMANRSIVK